MATCLLSRMFFYSKVSIMPVMSIFTVDQVYFNVSMNSCTIRIKGALEFSNLTETKTVPQACIMPYRFPGCDSCQNKFQLPCPSYAVKFVSIHLLHVGT